MQSVKTGTSDWQIISKSCHDKDYDAIQEVMAITYTERDGLC